MTDPATDSQTERIEQLLLRILDAPDDRQSEALEEICREQQELAPRLRRRLQDLARFGLVTATGDGGVAGFADDGPAPERIGPYRIVRTLGRGGMGVVYLADHEQLGRRVAIKCIRAEFLGSARARERFRRETQAAARLLHPSLCTLYEAGEFEGQPYIAMQFVAGETLEQQLRRARSIGRTCWSGNLSADSTSASASGNAPTVGIRNRLRDSVAMIEQLARAVHVAHEAGLVHRDLKPANVMVTPEGRPVLLDFGLARDLATDAPAFTLSADVVGTPAYMAPEQVDPRGRTVDRATDVHALGAILYECLTLRPPFAGTGREDTYRRILTEEPVELRRLQPAAGRDLASVVHKALAKEPSRRFHSALDFADELARVLRGEPTHTRPSGPVGRTWAWAKRQPLVAGSLLALFISLAAGLSTAIWLLRDARAANKTYASRELVTRDPAAAALLAADALDLGGGEPARSALYEALTSLRQVKAWPLLNTADLVAATPDGSVLAAAVYCGPDQAETTVHLFRSGVERQVVATGRPRVLQVDAEHDRILAVGHLLTARLFDLHGDRIADLPGQPADVMEREGQKSPRNQILRGLVAGGIQGADVYIVTRDGQVRLFGLDGACHADRSFIAPAPESGWICADRDSHTGMFALGGIDGSVALWSAAGEQIWRRVIHKDGPTRFIAFAPDGRSLLSAAGWPRHWIVVDGDVVHHDFSAAVVQLDGAIRFPLRGHKGGITSASWSPDGKFVLTTSEDRTARVWSIGAGDSDGRVPCEVLSHDKIVDGGRFFPDGRRILTNMTTNEAAVWDRDGHRLAELRGHGSGAFCGAVIGAGDQVVTGSMNKRLLLWDAHSRWCCEWQTTAPLTFAGFDLDGTRVWTVSEAGRLEWWAPDRYEPVAAVNLAALLERDEKVQIGACWRERGVCVVGTSRERILAIHRDGSVTVERASHQVAAASSEPPQSIGALIADRDRLLFGVGLRSLVLKTATGEQRIEMRQLTAVAGRVDEGFTGIAFAPDASGFAVGTDGQHVWRFDEEGRPIASPPSDFGSSVMGLAFGPGAQPLFAATRDGLIFRIDRSGASTQVADLGCLLLRLAVAPDGAWLAASCGDRSVRIVSRSGRLQLTLPPLRDGIRCIDISADGRRLLVASEGGDLRMWTLDLTGSGREILANSPYRAALEGARAAR